MRPKPQGEVSGSCTQAWRASHRLVVGSLFLLVPWLDLCVAAVMFFVLSQVTVIQPGRILALDRSTQLEGEGLLAKAPTALLRRLSTPSRGVCTILLLEDGRYSSDREGELEALSRLPLSGELNLIVDREIPYAQIMAWVERLKACGAQRINFVEAQR